MVGSPVLFIAIPLLAAFLIPLFGKLWKESVRIIPGLVLVYLGYLAVNLLSYTMANGAIVEKIAGWGPPWGIDLVFSPLSGFLITLMILMGILIWLYSYRFKNNVDFEPATKYFTLLMMLVTASVGVVLTGDVFNQFVFIEILGISAYGLTAFYKGRNAAEATFKYLLIGGLASTFLLLAIMILYSQLGTLNMADIAIKAHTLKPIYKFTILAFFIASFGIEAEMFPMNGWAPDAYTEAPGPVGAAFAGIVAKAGIYTIIRLTFTLFDVQGTMTFLVVMGMITLIVSEFAALKQDKIKRMLAYSSMGQMGLAMLAFGIGTEEGVFAALFLLFNHAVIKSLLFMSGSYLVYNSKNKFIAEMNGVGKFMPITAFLFALGAFAIIGLPPFAGFWSKLYTLMAAANQQMVLIIGLVLLVSLVEVVYYLRVVNRMFFVKREENDEYEEIPYRKPSINAMASMLILGAVIILVGFYPDLITGILHKASADLLDTSGYIHSVLSSVVSH